MELLNTIRFWNHYTCKSIISAPLNSLAPFFFWYSWNIVFRLRCHRSATARSSRPFYFCFYYSYWIFMKGYWMFSQHLSGRGRARGRGRYGLLLINTLSVCKKRRLFLDFIYGQLTCVSVCTKLLHVSPIYLLIFFSLVLNERLNALPMKIMRIIQCHAILSYVINSAVFQFNSLMYFTLRHLLQFAFVHTDNECVNHSQQICICIFIY